jgi:predicted esterase
VLATALILLAYHIAVHDFHMQKIRIVLSEVWKRICYRTLVAALFLFDTFIVSLCCHLIYFYYKKLLAAFFYEPIVQLFYGTPSWKLLGPGLVFLLYFACVGYFVLIRYKTKPDAETIKQREPMQRQLFYGSLLTILVLLNVLCFVALFSSESVPWLDIRRWPWWAMIVPFTLVVFSVSGLLLTRKKAGTAALILLVLFAFQSNVNAAPSQFTLIEPAKFVSDRDARDAAQKQSVAGGGGFYAEPKVVDCFAAMEYKYTGGRYDNEAIRFRLRSPQVIKPDKKYPLIVWFHGRGESGNDNARQLAHLQIAMEFFAGANQRDFFVLATQCPADNNQWTRSIETEGKGDAPMTIAGEIMEALLQEYPIDPNMLSACGFSSGATGSWEFGRKSPRRLAALGACSGNPVKEAEPEEYLGPAIWAFNNSGDASVSSADATVFIEAINSGGGNAYLSLFDQSGHDSWTKAMRDEKIIGWLILQSLEKPGPPQGIVCRPLSVTSQLAMFGLPVLIIVATGMTQLLKRRRTL